MHTMKPVSGVEFAKLLGASPQTITNLCAEGMPHSGGGGQSKRLSIDLAQALPWLWSRRLGASAERGSERERLAKEQADKIALQNMLTRKEVILREHVRLVLLESNSLLAAQLDGVAGRLANEVAAMTEPAKVRRCLLDEHRRIRSAYAAALGKLADSGEHGENTLEAEDDGGAE